MTGTLLLGLGAFLASAVEAVEALTIVLGVGVVRGWRSTLIGAAAALIVLAALIAVLGPALGRVPIDGLRLVVGALLLVFGLQWLRKAILRASGYKALHDEDESFREERERALAAGASPSAQRREGWTSRSPAPRRRSSLWLSSAFSCAGRSSGCRRTRSSTRSV